jgi:hypothetical protein
VRNDAAVAFLSPLAVETSREGRERESAVDVVLVPDGEASRIVAGRREVDEEAGAARVDDRDGGRIGDPRGIRGDHFVLAGRVPLVLPKRSALPLSFDAAARCAPAHVDCRRITRGGQTVCAKIDSVAEANRDLTGLHDEPHRSSDILAGIAGAEALRAVTPEGDERSDERGD